MSGGACVVIIAESLKLKPSPMLENCLRANLQNPLVVERVGPDSFVWQLGVKPLWSKSEQRAVQDMLRDIVKTDMPHIVLPGRDDDD